MPSSPEEIILLDNGSLEPASVFSLRRIAKQLAEKLGKIVHPVSLLHSGKIPASELGGIEAQTLTPFLKERYKLGTRRFRITPLFFGPSGALTDYLPERLSKLRETCPELEVSVAPWLHAANDDRLLEILNANAQALLSRLPTSAHPSLLLVDHGSPKKEVTAVRDELANLLRQRLGKKIRALSPASMERRPEPEYAFNEPLLEQALRQEGFSQGEVLVCLLFLSPGRHAGPGGDIAQICAAAEKQTPGLKIHLTPLVGEHPLLIDILADRTLGN